MKVTLLNTFERFICCNDIFIQRSKLVELNKMLHKDAKKSTYIFFEIAKTFHVSQMKALGLLYNSEANSPENPTRLRLIRKEGLKASAAVAVVAVVASGGLSTLTRETETSLDRFICIERQPTFSQRETFPAAIKATVKTTPA